MFKELQEESEVTVRAYLADELARWAEAEAQLRARGDYCEHNRPRWRQCASCDDALRRQAVKLREASWECKGPPGVDFRALR